ncbi:hypothetical protein ES695_07225 [Candidatus Atribacteria bacterium 1244-E10-H5-B2]|nr:MAG: hypothetical protein ES695_07225 [Candidatus Atribacteria bacterium 1244-E10-H5-B2]
MAKKRRKPYTYKSPESEARAKANFPQYRKKTLEEIQKEAREFQSKRKKLKDLNIIEFAENPIVLGLSFAKRPAQKVILKVLYGLPLNKKEIEIFNILTKNKGKYKPGMEKTEAVLALGARAGKSFLVSICALYEATVGWMNKPWKETLSVGEYVYVCIVATRELQARKIIQENCLRMLERSPMLKGLIKKSTDLEITLRNYVKIISGPCNSTALRGLPIIFLALDEIAFFRIEGPKADEVIFNSLRPRMAQFIGNKLFMISTAGSKQGLFFDFFNEGFNIQDRLTCQAPTDFINPLIPKAFLEKEKARDLDNYLREYEAIFAERMEAFFSFDMLNECFIVLGDQKYISTFTYNLGIDASGLAGRDLFGLAVSHRQGSKVIIDYAKSFNTKNLDVIVDEIKTLKKNYKLGIAVIDRFSKGFVRAILQKLGLVVVIRPSLADIYVNAKSLAISGNLSLPVNNELKKGLLNTQAFYSKSNSLTIGHPRDSTGHSDLADACITSIFQSSRMIGEEKLGGILHYSSPGEFWVERNPKSKPEPFNWPHKVTPEEEAKEKEEETFNWY